MVAHFTTLGSLLVLSLISTAISTPAATTTQSGLVARQSEYPSRCRSVCDDIYDSLNNCSTAACACSSSKYTQFSTCLTCSSSASEAKEILADYKTACSEEGITVVAGNGGGSSNGPVINPFEKNAAKNSVPFGIPTVLGVAALFLGGLAFVG